jgi:hypothetical protein
MIQRPLPEPGLDVQHQGRKVCPPTERLDDAL